MKKTVLITGGSGYLGQHLIHTLQDDFKVLYTYNREPLKKLARGNSGYKVDFVSGSGLVDAFNVEGGVDAVINCAAVSQPAVCEKDEAYARSINIPSKLLDALKHQLQATGKEALLIHISTDQVYDGSKAMWTESDPCHPVNAYGRSKLAAEQEIGSSWPQHVILRSSIIYGPLTPDHIDRTLFIQFIDSVLAKGQATTSFEDEFRCPVYVADIAAICRKLLLAEQPPPHKVYNMGGPERLSRVDMALAVAAARGHDSANILSVPSASVARGVRSPADISMDIAQLQSDLGISMTPFATALEQTFATAGSVVS